MRRKGRFDAFRLEMLSVALLVLSSAASELVAQQPIAQQSIAQQSAFTPVTLDQLPAPPREIADLLKSSGVTFEFGQRRNGDARSGTPTPGGQRGDRGGRQPRIVAETRFQISYHYRNQSRWNLSSNRDTLTVQLRFTGVRLTQTHRIWFEKRPETEGFWSDRLVLHELDHVRISSDPRLARRFASMLRERSVLTETIPRGVAVDRAYVDEMVERHVAEVFSEIRDLVGIRYRELDRLTGHGLRPIPGNSELRQLLAPLSEPR